MQKTETVSRSRSSKNQKDGPVGSAILTVEVEGEYNDFKSFLYDVERSVALVDVAVLEIQVADDLRPGEEEGITYTVGLQAYWLKAE